MEMQIPRYQNLNEFLCSEQPWEYDFKFQFNMKLLCEFIEQKVKRFKQEKISQVNNLTCESAVQRFLRYKSQPPNDVFDCDGSGIGDQAYLCWLTRTIYRTLWGWEDLADGTDGSEPIMVKRYGLSCFSDRRSMGPETINSFQTTFTEYQKMEKPDFVNTRPLIEQFARTTHCIGNFILTFQGYNQYVGKDYWDIKLREQYLIRHPGLFFQYINTFFLWDYVQPNGDIKSLFAESFHTCTPLKLLETDSHSKYLRGEAVDSILPTSSEIRPYLENVNWAIRRRGIFMVAMLELEQKIGAQIYDKLRSSVFAQADAVYNGYDAVFEAVKAYLEAESLCTAVQGMLEAAQQRIRAIPCC